MTSKFYLPLFALLLLSRCEKSGLCEDDELTLKKVDYAGNQLSIDGYYFGDITENSTPAYAEIYYLYRNGVFFTSSASLLDDAEAGTIDVPLGPGNKPKRSFGLFQINGNTIEIDRWQGSVTGCEETIYEKGNIVNDSTFVITRREFREDGEATNVRDVNFTFKFRPLPEKPDSSNSFIE